MIYCVTFILAYRSIIYELVMAQSLSAFLGDTVLRYSTTVGLYLASLGIGAFLCRGGVLQRPVYSLVKIEILLSVVGGFCLVYLHFCNLLISSGNLFFLFSHALIIAIGILSGFEIPLLIDINWLIFYNTIKAAGFTTIVPFASVLEEDNPALYEALRKEYNMEKEDIKQVLPLVRDLSMGFIMMRKNGDIADMRYKENGVKKHVLNEQRYNLAFSLSYPMPQEIDRAKVNSIMRPALPTLSLLRIRLPY